MRPIHPIPARLAIAVGTAMLATSSGCVRSLDRPFVGDCAVYPDGVFTFGEIDIGTCLAGPVDLQFFERDGRTWLLVSNADPFYNFDSGSLLLVDWASVDLDRRFNLMSELDAHAIRTTRFNGQMALARDRGLVLVPNRFSEDAVSRSHDDQGFVFDISDPTDPRRWEPNPVIGMQDDPYLAAVDEARGLAFIGNLTDHSISVFDLEHERLAQIDVRPETVLGRVRVFDDDASGSVVDLDRIAIVDPQRAFPDVWTLTFVEDLVRLWVPTPDGDDDLGIVRWTGGNGLFTPSARGVEVGPSAQPAVASVTDPFLTLDSAGLQRLFFVDEGVIVTLRSTGLAADWGGDTVAPFTGGPGDFDAIVGGPSVAILGPTQQALYYHGRPTPGAPASIGVATSDDGLAFGGRAEPVLTDPDASLEQPFAVADGIARRLRMWMSRFDGATWTIALAESDDGFAWSAPEIVLEIPGGHAAAPAVDYVNGHYEMYFTLGDGAGWTHARAWSWDGRAWFDVEELVASEVPFDLESPPRAALRLDATDAWRVVGRDQGQLDNLVPAGTSAAFLDVGIGFAISDGHAAPDELLPDGRSANGMLPGSVAEVDGLTTLYVTAIGSDERERLAVLRPVGDGFAVLETNVIPAGEGGNVAGVSDPVVLAHDGGYTLFYAARGADGGKVVRRAASDDGVTFTPLDGAVLDREDWAGVEMRPSSVQVLDDGSVRLWFSGFDGSRWRIGAATADDPRARFTLDPGPFDPWQLEAGPLGGIDDSGVRDPAVFEEGGVVQMYYAGFDGLEWHIGHAVFDGGVWVRRTAPGQALPIAAMSGLPASFSTAGVERPVLDRTGPTPRLWYAGRDVHQPRLGLAIPDGEVVFPAQRFPTPGDRVTFQVVPGDGRRSNIELQQRTQDLQPTGIGMSSMTFDPDRGFLYVSSKLANFLYVIDVRDDTASLFDDTNYLDVEAFISVRADVELMGFRDVLVDPVRDRLYATSRNPDGVVVLDLDDIVDDDAKEIVYDAAEAVLPMLGAAPNDAGRVTDAEIGSNGMALSADGNVLLVTHLRDNSLWAFDLRAGSHGEPLAYLPNIGENPHLVRVTPDGRHAVVANYLGDVSEGRVVSSTLAVVDLDPDSPTYLEVLTWLVNE